MQYCEFCKSQMMNLIVFWDFLFRCVAASPFSLNLLRFEILNPLLYSISPLTYMWFLKYLGILKINLSLHSQKSNVKHAFFHI